MKPPSLVRSPLLAAASLLEDLAAFVAANLVFGLTLLLVLVAVRLSILGTLLAIGLALPAAGVMRAATVHVRRGTARAADFGDGLRHPLRTLALAAAQLAATFLLGLDAALGWSMASVPGGALTVAALWGLLALWTYAVVAWPLLLDPDADERPVRATLRLAWLVILWRPLPALGLALLVGLVLGLSVASVLGVLVFGIALSCLLAAHWVLPAADVIGSAAPSA